MKVSTATVLMLVGSVLPERSLAFSPSSLHRQPLAQRRFASTTWHRSSKGSKGEEDPLPGIVETNVPSVVKTKKGGFSSDVMKNRLARRKPRFESPPERESGYYESCVHLLSDGHRLGFDEYYVAENEHDLVVCKFC